MKKKPKAKQSGAATLGDGAKSKTKVFLVSFKVKGRAPEFSMSATELRRYLGTLLSDPEQVSPVNLTVSAIRIEVENQK